MVVSETGSTNKDLGLEASKGAPEGSVLISERQRAGRGRQGRTWFDSGGESLAVSWLMRPSSPPDTWGLIPLLTGVAVVEVVHSLDIGAKLKWPNDVLVGKRKVAGILCESTTGEVPCVVIGLGVNISWKNQELRPEISDVATSLAEYCQEPPSSVELARLVLSRFEMLWQSWHGQDGQNVQTADLVQEYSTHCNTLQQEQVVFDAGMGSELRGRPLRIDDGGGLWLQTAAGRQLVNAGDVHHLPT